MIALTGISNESLEDLQRRHIRTFEVRSAHNVIALSSINPGDPVFLTDVVPSDLTSGICGIIATVRNLDIRMSRITFGTRDTIEEREAMTTRIQLALSSKGKIRSIEKIENYKPIIADVIDVKMCEAR